MRRLLSIALAAVLLTSCFYPSDRGRALETRVDKLEADRTQLAQQVKAEQEKIDALIPQINAKIAEVSKALASLDQAARRSGADQGVQLQKTLEDVAALRGQLETEQHRLGVLEDAMKELSDSAKEAKPPPLVRPTDKKAYLALAQKKVEEKDLPLARTLFNEFLQKWPKDPLAADAHFELGETYFDEHKCREALFEYGKVIQDFAKAKVAPKAYLHSGTCFAALDMRKEAQLAYEELIRSHPKSEEAKQAKKELAALSKKPAKPAPKPHHGKK